MFSKRRERSRLLYPSRYPEGPPEENLSPAKRCWSAKFVSRHIHPVLINVECWICDNCWRWRERLIAAVAGRVKLLEVTTGSPLASHEHPDFKAAWRNRGVLVLTICLAILVSFMIRRLFDQGPFHKMWSTCTDDFWTWWYGDRPVDLQTTCICRKFTQACCYPLQWLLSFSKKYVHLPQHTSAWQQEGVLWNSTPHSSPSCGWSMVTSWQYIYL